ncbi:MAG: tRNA (guanosine(37)-N1)-methyltransferase TrmD [Lysobacterales bacterium]
MQIDVVTLFPGEFRQCLDIGVTGRAMREGIASVTTWNPRDFAKDSRGTVDDRPFGGGPGMLMTAPVLNRCLDAVLDKRSKDERCSKIRYLSPQGQQVTQATLQCWSQQPDHIWLCGRYEGIDERLLSRHDIEQWSLGDFVLSGGELAAAAVIDGVVRLLPGALGHAQSADQDSFSEGLLDCPHFTRPEQFDGCSVPQVLRSGDHGAIARWRLKQSLGVTWLKRPELINRRGLSCDEAALLEEFLDERHAGARNQREM